MDEATVRAMYRTLGYERGWSFAMTPVARMETADTVIVGLNPGGTSGGEHWEFPTGNSYFDEPWRPNGTLNSLQLQIAKLYQLLDLSKDDVFAAQFIPFRSPRLSGLEKRKQAIAFGREIWAWVVARSPARRYICMGQLAGSNLASLLHAPLEQRYPSGHGVTTIGRYVSKDGRVVAELPHPSHYGILSLTMPEALEQAKAGVLKAARLD